LADPPVGVLVALACSTAGVYGVVLSGWAAGSTYPMLGGLRSAAQIISYEVVMGLSIAGVLLVSGSLRTSDIVTRQAHAWYVILVLPSFLSYFLSAVGETNRAPLDLPEAESELVGGFNTEYSSVKFMLLYLAEYTNMISFCGLCTTLFLGGWRVPWPLSAIGDGMLNGGWWPPLLFLLKLVVLLFVFVWLPGNTATDAVRPVHAVELEGPATSQPGMDPAGGRCPGERFRAGGRAVDDPAGAIVKTCGLVIM